eukprot:5487468-Pleurochrysis_carterae.AAC.1
MHRSGVRLTGAAGDRGSQDLSRVDRVDGILHGSAVRVHLARLPTRTRGREMRAKPERAKRTRRCRCSGSPTRRCARASRASGRRGHAP